MIPIHLSIEGLYSYRSRQTIDFTNLTQAGLFGIFGGVGSGKSSILEAISFALYGESERLNAKERRYYNMMNLKSKKLVIEFRFKSHNDTEYLFTVQGSRNRNKFEDVGAFERRAARLDGGQWIPIPVGDAEKITGLNYQNFRRTIIIPQGKFQEFLQLSPSDRTTMLKELFNLSKYELSDKINRLDLQNGMNIERLSGEITGIGEVNPEMISELERKHKDLQIQKVTESKKLTISETAEHQQQILKKLAGDFAEQKKQQAELQRTAPVITTLENRLKEYTLFYKLFRADFTQQENLKSQASKSEKDISAGDVRLAELEKQCVPVIERLKSLKDAYDSRDQLKQESEETARYADLKSKQAAYEKLAAEEKQSRIETEALTNLVLKTKAELAQLTLAVEQKRKTLPDYRILMEVKAWFAEKLRMEKSFAENRKKAVELTKSLESMALQIRTLILNSGLFEPGTESEKGEECLSVIGKLKQETDEKLRIQNEVISELDVRKRLEDFAATLHDGKPCPLCGSENHPHKIDASGVDLELDKARESRKQLEEIIRRCHELDRSLSQLLQKRETLVSLQDTLNAELGQLDHAVSMHKEHFTWEGYDPSDDAMVKENEALYEQISREITVSEKNLKTMSGGMETNLSLLETKQTKLGRIKEEMAAGSAAISMIKGMISDVVMEKHEKLNAEELIAKSAALASEYTKLCADYTGAEKRLVGLEQESGVLKGKLEVMKQNHLELSGRLATLQAQIAEKLEKNGNPGYDRVAEVLAQEPDVDAEKARIDLFYQSVATVATRLEELERELDGRQYDETIHLGMRDEIGELKLKIQTLDREIGGLVSSITALKKNLEKYQTLKKELDKAELRKQDLADLKRLFWGAGFVNYVSTVYLENLCKAANERFNKLTRQKLGLELSSDNTFLVRDYMNDGLLRSVKTLSGGQTFQASLSLALALADSIHKLAGSSENFFFLDEGFGTLDKETLEVAFDTLKALRKENRIVGVISHVEEMQAEIGAFLKVTNDEERGSVVRGSWEEASGKTVNW